MSTPPRKPRKQTDSLEDEIWLDIPGSFPYQVSNLGRVCNINTDLILKASKDAYGYLRVNLLGKSKLVHCLVALAFLGERPIDQYGYRYDVNHKNGIRHDATLDNLEYITKNDNILHSYGLHPPETRPAPAHTKRANLDKLDPTEVERMCEIAESLAPVAYPKAGGTRHGVYTDWQYAVMNETGVSRAVANAVVTRVAIRLRIPVDENLKSPRLVSRRDIQNNDTTQTTP